MNEKKVIKKSKKNSQAKEIWRRFRKSKTAMLGRKILAERLNISPEQLKFVTNSPPGEGLLFFENVILPFADKFPRDTELYRIMSTKPSEVNGV